MTCTTGEDHERCFEYDEKGRLARINFSSEIYMDIDQENLEWTLIIDLGLKQ